ncbi:carbohydrate ABC transporter permease [Thermogemmatispora sp.]|uniref:carbohydrate ABC transporter permease n=1 Tax=Thermogemmatispora sp. TaxID=1968838 RepID=UPI0035E454D4
MIGQQVEQQLAPALVELTRRRQQARRRTLLRRLSDRLITVVALLIAVIWSLPTLGLLISSFRPPSLISTTGWWTALLPPWHFTLQNYVQVVTAQGLGRAFINSVIIAVPSTILPALIGSFAAFAFAWMRFPARNAIFFAIITLQIIPLQIALVPLLQIFTSIGLTGQYAAVWLAHTAFGLPFAIFLLRNFFAALPRDLLEAAYVDGASNFRLFWTIVLPLSLPALASLVIFQFLWVWNDLLVALIFLGGNPQSAPMTLTVASLVGSYGENDQVLTAAAFLSMALPLVIFFALQRYFIRGILAGSVKG